MLLMGKMQYLPGVSAPLHPGVVILGSVCTPEWSSKNCPSPGVLWLGLGADTYPYLKYRAGNAVGLQ